MLKLYSKYFPYAVIGILLLNAYVYWNKDIDQVLMTFVAIIGWISYIEIRREYDTFYDMVMGHSKDDTQS